MPFATPLALLGLLFVPAVIAMYLLKLRRDEAVVPSTLLWQRLVTDVEAIPSKLWIAALKWAQLSAKHVADLCWFGKSATVKGAWIE